MRHGKRINHLGRQRQHRVLMMRNMGSSLILHKRIKTTLAKAKALRRFIEPLITRGKVNSTHNRRMCFRNLQQKEAVTELFTDVAAKVADRPGGYTRIVRIGTRYGDNAEMCIIELVDYNEVYTTERKAGSGKKKTRRRRGGAAKAGAATTATDVAETVAEETQETATAVVEEVQETITDTVEDIQDTVADVVDDTNSVNEESTDKPATEQETPPADEASEEQK